MLLQSQNQNHTGQRKRGLRVSIQERQGQKETGPPSGVSWRQRGHPQGQVLEGTTQLRAQGSTRNEASAGLLLKSSNGTASLGSTPPLSIPTHPAASHLRARPCQVNSCSPRSKAPQTPALPTAAKATSHHPPARPEGGEMLINHREMASGQPRRQAEETQAGRELPARPQGRSAPL